MTAPKLFGVEMERESGSRFALGHAMVYCGPFDPHWMGCVDLFGNDGIDESTAAGNLEHAIKEKLLTPLGITAKLERLERLEAAARLVVDTVHRNGVIELLREALKDAP